RHRDGTTNLPRSQTDTSSQPTPIHLGIVSLRQLSADIQDEAGGHHGALGPIDLSLDTRGTGQAPGTFGPSAISGVVGGGDTGTARSISGTISGSLGFNGERISMKSFRVDTPEARLMLNGELDLIAETIRLEAQGRLETDLARVGRFFDLGDSLSGTAAADITVKGPAADPT